LLLRWRDGEFEAVMSPALLDELGRVLHTLATRVNAQPGLAEEWVDLVALGAEWVTPAETLAARRDPGDNAVLAAAVAGRVVCIISGDQYLLLLGEFQGTPIVTPRQFVNWLDSD
jgi:putative PIN family toxin of toxin-antitoxin system